MIAVPICDVRQFSIGDFVAMTEALDQLGKCERKATALEVVSVVVRVAFLECVHNLSPRIR